MYRVLRHANYLSLAPLLLVHDRYTLQMSQPPTKERIRGQYENKIRFMSPPEKVFELFATIKDDEGLFMSYEDFMRAMVPYNYRGAKEGDETEEEKKNYNNLMKFADLDGDGKISIYEYFLVGRFLSLIEGELKKYINGEELTQQQMIDYL